MIAGATLLGPLATMGLYRLSRQRMGLDNSQHSDRTQVFLVAVTMMILVLMWLRAGTVLFAVFFGLRPFASFIETVQTLFQSSHGIALVVIGTGVGGLFAAIGFAISVFSFPMLAHRNIDGFSAMALSFNATTHNFRLAVTWGAVVTGAFILCVASGLILFIPIFPLLGYATWHAYFDLFEREYNSDV
ncbi:DUF2189 domain-containing protein [Rhodobacteraceae bacterium]|nr:DUF2189 domain-containing protein [Paracoccaceae bacterium]